MRRRDVLRAGAATMLGAGLLHSNQVWGRFGELFPDSKPINPWGPSATNRPISRILEIYLYGGLSPWETFYVNQATAAGGACGTSCPQSPTANSSVQWGTYQCQFEALARADTRRPSSLPFTKQFDQEVHLGPATYPLWRPDLFDHLQILVTSHDLLPHEAAVPYALTGTRLGRPTMAGTGAVINANQSDRGIPVAFVIKPQGETATDNILAALATGNIGSAHKPMLIEVPCGGPDLTVLNRDGISDQEAQSQDALLDYYLRQYRSRLTWPGKTVATRSPAFGDYDGTMGQFFKEKDIKNLLQGYDPNDNGPIQGTEPACVAGVGTPVTSRCPGKPMTDFSVRQALNFATFLLKLPQTRYVCVMDLGLQIEAGAGYDTHANHAQGTYRSLTSTLEVIANLTNPNQPGGSKIDPFTMIVITTEFGRTPNREGTGGRGHYPYAYANVIIPPSIDLPAFPPRPGKRLVGGIDASARVARRGSSNIASITPTDLRAAMLLGLGVDALAKADATSTGSIFGVGDLSEAMQGTEESARAKLIRDVLGYPVGGA